jgi:hypothetical protein
MTTLIIIATAFIVAALRMIEWQERRTVEQLVAECLNKFPGREQADVFKRSGWRPVAVETRPGINQRGKANGQSDRSNGHSL